MKTKFKNYLGAILTLSITAFSSVESQAQETKSSENGKWSFLVQPYAILPHMSGTIGVADFPVATLEASSNQILHRLNMTAMLYAEASNDKWAIGYDLIYMSLSQQGIVPENGYFSGDLATNQLAWEISALRRVTPWLELGVGGSVNSITSRVDMQVAPGLGLPDVKKAVTKTWFDPMLVARVKGKLAEKIIYQVRGEIGGFGVGSDLAWQAEALAGYQISKLISLTGGYRFISLDYNKGVGEDHFMYNMQTSGPTVKLGFNF